ncbi:ketosteroid isomerase family protein [Methylobacterium aerolatum]|uniref:Ketosteroid isomerase-like protein n=1 Tax=Methylobacterium aerolatum TaxID=418708 RepID=A0ABU0I2K3_9HYPH|nr:ketosteroid isomerase family protein [Methylobacterium aerolatum]MDQ0448830.1 ketosteroid isomerase-like protein [Methylobacterium aerolatum]
MNPAIKITNRSRMRKPRRTVGTRHTTRDMDALAKLYAQDAVVVSKGAYKRSGEITEFFSSLKTKGWDEHKTTVNGVLPKDDLLIVMGRWEMSGPT